MAGSTNDGSDDQVQLEPEPEESQDVTRRRGPGLNRVELIGRLAADPDVRYTPSGKIVANIRLATNTSQQAEFHQIVAFGQVGDFVAKYMRQGRLVYVEGRLRSRAWVDADGVRHYVTEILVNDLQALDRKTANQ